MARTGEIIDLEIAAIKAANANWVSDGGILACITALTNEKNLLGGILLSIFLHFVSNLPSHNLFPSPPLHNYPSRRNPR